MKTILFACVHNAGRSQMAAAFFNALADPDKAKAISAGTKPGARVHPEVVEVMKEEGLDLSGVQPQLLTVKLASGAFWLITMGCGEDCPVILGLHREDWPFEDPKGKGPEQARVIRDQIRAKVRSFVDEKGWGRGLSLR